MIFTPHIIVGAVIGAKTQNLGLIIILGILTHIILDKLPHWDYPVKKYTKNFKKTKKIKSILPLVLHSTIDVVVGLLIVFFIVWQKDLFNLLPFIIIGIIASLLLDAVGAYVLLFTKESFAKKYLKFLHKYLHHSEGKQKEGEITFLGLATQIIVVIISVFLLSL
jgi:hypothetical protein